ncbi:hypothetical protein ABZS29_36245 [Kribbella sp. NPDC005582]|uniref:hypothetical protein n=1 Tax=Kribbella sp. NPDC005582 TaxID=3156893 RepID=UPI0033B0F348
MSKDAMAFSQNMATVDLPVTPSRLPNWFEPIRAVLGLAGVLAGAQLMVTNASAIASDLGVPQVIVGFASGSSAPGRAAVALSITMTLTAGLAWALLRRGLTLTRVEALALLATYALTMPLLLST